MIMYIFKNFKKEESYQINCLYFYLLIYVLQVTGEDNGTETELSDSQ